MMLKIEKAVHGEQGTLILSGRVDAEASKDLTEALSSLPAGLRELILDLAGVDYISSAGLRVVLSTAQTTKADMRIIHTRPAIMDIFRVTGFAGFLNIS